MYNLHREKVLTHKIWGGLDLDDDLNRDDNILMKVNALNELSL